MNDFIAIFGKQADSIHAFAFIQHLAPGYDVTNGLKLGDNSFSLFFDVHSNRSLQTSDVAKSEQLPYRLTSCKLPIAVRGRVDNLPSINKATPPALPNTKLLSQQRPSDFTSEQTEELLYRYLSQQNVSHHDLKGNVSLVYWDAESDTLQATIDTFNTSRLFYMRHRGVFYLSNNAQLLAEHPEMRITLNDTAVAHWLYGQPNPHLSMHKQISTVAGGHSICFHPDGQLNVQRDWDIDPSYSIRYKTPQEYEAHFYDLLHRSVDKRMTTTSNRIFCQMSGGMDSTSIVAHANALAAPNKLELHTVSHSYRNTNSCDEMPGINDMINHLSLKNSHFIELDKFSDISFSALYPTAFDSPGIVSSPKYHEELRLLQTSGANVLLTGNGGDETCWGHSATYRSRLYRGDISVVREVAKGCKALEQPVVSSLVNLFVKPLIPQQVINLLRLARGLPSNKANNEQTAFPPWLTDKSIALIQQSNNAFNPYSARLQPALHARYNSIHNTSTYNSMRSYQRVADGYGVDVRHPFFDQEVVEFSFAVPEKLLIQGIYPKWLLRKTMDGYLPSSVCWKKTKVVFDHHFANLIRSNAKELRHILSHTGLQAQGLINNKVLLDAFDHVVASPDMNLNVDMLYAILTQCWYQTHVETDHAL